MSLELVNTFGTLVTVAIIAATAIAAMAQLRHLRAGNQINAMLSIGNQFDEKEFRDAETALQHRWDSVIEDPAFREFDFALLRRLPTSDVPKEYRELRRSGLLIGNTYEELGILIKNDIIDRELFLDRYAWVILGAWDRLSRWVAWSREVSDQPSIWENFEYLAVLSQDFFSERKTTYPKGVRRIELRNPWPVPTVPTMSATA